MSAAEVRRLIHAASEPEPVQQQRRWWSHVRRHHQATAQACHQQRRARQAPPVAFPLPASIRLSCLPDLTDAAWEQVRLLVPPQKPRAGRPGSDRRLLVEGILWVARAGVSWRRLPARYGSWSTVSSWYRRWCKDGRWDQIVQVLSQATGALAQRLVRQAQDVLPLVERVIHQTRQRVFLGQKVVSDEKVLSLREPHTKTVPRHKGGQQVEFGRQVMLDEVDGGIVTRDEILAHPTEHGQAVPAVEHHQALFDHPPGLVTGDRGVHAADTEARLRQLGVKRVAIPASGTVSEARRAEEHTRAFRRGYRFRAGIEGRIASVRRDDGWRTCRYHGLDGMERWLGLGLMARNLRRIAQARG